MFPFIDALRIKGSSLIGFFVFLLLFFIIPLAASSLEPYSVRVVYFIANDSVDDSEKLGLPEIMKNVQSVYRDELNRNGFPNKTFKLENGGDRVIIHKLNGKHDKNHYYTHDTLDLVKQELPNHFNTKKYVIVIVMAGLRGVQFGRALGMGKAGPDGWSGDDEYHGYVILSDRNSDSPRVERVIMHELGHVFGLWHIVLTDPKDYIMGSGRKFFLHEAMWLSNSHYFRDDHSFSRSPRISNLFPAEALIKDRKHYVRFKIDLSDNEGMYQIYLFLDDTNTVGWEFIKGARNVSIIDVERRFLLNDGIIWVQTMDVDGNWHWHNQNYRMPDKLPDPEPEPEEPEEMIYKDFINNGTQSWDFEKDAKGWKVANGNWSVDNGLYKVSRGGKAEHSLVGQSDWKNYTIDAKVRIDDIHWAGIVFRAKSEMEYYVYYLNTLDNRSELWKHNAGAWDNRQEIAWTFAVGGVHIKNNVWFNVTVEVLEDKFICYINGKKQIEKLHGSYEIGKVGVWTWETAASFDDFTISKIDIDDNFAVDPIGKLTTLWGHIKQLD